MVLHSDAFYDGDQQTGVLLRDEREGQLATFVSFVLDGGAIYRAEQVTGLGEAPAGWTSFRFSEATTGVVTLGVQDAAGVSVGGVLLEAGAVPSYLGWRILVDLARRGGERVAFRQLDEHGDPEVHDAELVDRGIEAIAIPGLDLPAARRYDLLLDGGPYTSFWWDGQHVVASDWTAGSMSVRAEGLEPALAGCPVRVAELARSWVAGRPR
ncbi:hypothetical protein [Pseudactinotalea suaedae]|uniref:hypothetical protein n=1 Tax=Pseudactinotalea suaedae TaxID=1524924 RepID=UPI0012E14EC0|nr:hypothetical protein [Pseudactinotalea suaedae]